MARAECGNIPAKYFASDLASDDSLVTDCHPRARREFANNCRLRVLRRQLPLLRRRALFATRQPTVEQNGHATRYPDIALQVNRFRRPKHGPIENLLPDCSAERNSR